MHTAKKFTRTDSFYFYDAVGVKVKMPILRTLFRKQHFEHFRYAFRVKKRYVFELFAPDFNIFNLNFQ